MLSFSQRELNELQPDNCRYCTIVTIDDTDCLEFYANLSSATEYYNNIYEENRIYCGLSVDYSLYCERS